MYVIFDVPELPVGGKKKKILDTNLYLDLALTLGPNYENSLQAYAAVWRKYKVELKV